MLESLFPRTSARYSCQPVLGQVLGPLCAWLRARGYPRYAINRRMRGATPLARALSRRGVRSLRQLTASELRSFVPPPRPSNSPPQGALARSLAEFLQEQGQLAPTIPTPTDHCVAEYCRYLGRTRGLSSGTIRTHAWTATEFLRSIGHDVDPQRLPRLHRGDVERFITETGRRVGRGRMSHVTAALRSFLRFLAVTSGGPLGLDMEVESPRIYRGERLPRAISWEAVRKFLGCIDRTTDKGRRDFAMFLLIATYGLRASEVRALCLDDIAWRTREIRLRRPKVGSSMLLPLTDEAATALVDYLRSRPTSPCRQVFLRVEFPLGPLGQGAVWNAFRTWARRAGIPASSGGPHCLRHAVAMRLLRTGATVKTIGDILGHRSAESTGVYLRLDVDDLREVALPLPVDGQKAVRS
jgi:integrase/recombinase XerD